MMRMYMYKHKYPSLVVVVVVLQGKLDAYKDIKAKGEELNKDQKVKEKLHSECVHFLNI